MCSYRTISAIEMQQVDASIEAGKRVPGDAAQLERSLAPIRGRFKDLLVENTIREVANFQSNLERERKRIVDRSARSACRRRRSYNPGRYIELEAQPRPMPIFVISGPNYPLAPKVRGKGQDGTRSEGTFLQVRYHRAVRGQGQPEPDRRWAAKVTFPRNPDQIRRVPVSPAAEMF